MTIQRRRFMQGSLAAAAAVGLQGAEANPVIESTRQAALAILKPSKKELEHGLALHADSLVIEPYGFSPRSAPDGDAIRRAIEAGASDLEIQDVTEDTLMTRSVTDPGERQEYMQAWQASGITCIFQNAGEESQDPLRLMKRLARFTYVADNMGGFVRRAVTPEDILTAKKDGKHCIYFTMNGVPLTQQWVSAEDELRYIRIFFQLGVRAMHLTYNRRNMIGDGCAEPGNAGLSDFGRMAVAEMNRNGVIIDVAHSGWQTSLEAAKASTKPIMASHSSCASVHKHIRSKPDEVIRAIADSGGFIGILAVPPFLGGSRDIAQMLNHIDYAAKRFGTDHVAIATDLAYASRNSNPEWEKIPKRQRRRAAWEYHWPPDAFAGQPRYHPSLAWANWPLFTVGLVQRGYTDDDIRKIVGGNALRLARAALS
jgi:membrane dipeptidase